jgi:hypothetical protein
VSLETVVENFMHIVDEPKPADLRKEPKNLIALIDAYEAVVVELRNTRVAFQTVLVVFLRMTQAVRAYFHHRRKLGSLKETQEVRRPVGGIIGTTRKQAYAGFEGKDEN